MTGAADAHAADAQAAAPRDGGWRRDERGILFGGGLAVLALFLASRVTTPESATIGALVLVAALLIAASLGGLRPGVAATVVIAVGVGAWLSSDETGIAWPIAAAGIALLVAAGLALSMVGGLRFASRLPPAARLAARVRRPTETPAAAGRLAATQAILARLSSATTASQVGDAVFTDALAASGADGAAMVTLTPDGRGVRLLGWGRRWTEGARELWLHELGPLADVILLGTPIHWAGSEAPGVDDLPFSALAGGPPRTVALVPLRGRQAIVGALGFAWAEPHPLPDDEREFVTSLGRHVGAALDRAMLLSMEQGLRRDAEATRREALRLRDELAAVVQSIREPVFVVAPDGAVTLRNRAAESLLGDVATISELARRLRGPHGPIDLTAGRRLRAELLETGRLFDVDVATTEGGTGSRIVSLRDVTEDRRAIEAKDAFIGVLSHELRTPVTTILGGIDLLQRGLPAPLGDEMLADVAAETERLRQLIEDLLILSRFERDALEIESEPVLAQRLLERIAGVEAARRDPPADIHVTMPVDLPPVAADPTYLDQVLRNIVANAVKYGADHGPIEITAEVIGDVVRIVVADRGPGFPAEDAERLFELFYRSHTTATKPGAGIGLFVARQLASGMGALLQARPRDGGGAEFTLTLRTVAADVEPGPRADGREADTVRSPGRRAETPATPRT